MLEFYLLKSHENIFTLPYHESSAQALPIVLGQHNIPFSNTSNLNMLVVFKKIERRATFLCGEKCLQCLSFLWCMKALTRKFEMKATNLSMSISAIIIGKLIRIATNLFYQLEKGSKVLSLNNNLD